MSFEQVCHDVGSVVLYGRTHAQSTASKLLRYVQRRCMHIDLPWVPLTQPHFFLRKNRGRGSWQKS